MTSRMTHGNDKLNDNLNDKTVLLDWNAKKAAVGVVFFFFFFLPPLDGVGRRRGRRRGR